MQGLPPVSLSTTQVFFFLEGAKVEMEVVKAIEETVLEIRDAYLKSNPTERLHHLSTDIAALWPKIDHLLYQPILGVERPRCFYYYQGDGLEAIYGFTYKYMTLEHFLGQLTRVQMGAPLAEALAAVYVRAWYPGDDPLTIFVDWHTKPHWTSSTPILDTLRCGDVPCQAPSNFSSTVSTGDILAAGTIPSTRT